MSGILYVRDEKHSFLFLQDVRMYANGLLNSHGGVIYFGATNIGKNNNNFCYCLPLNFAYDINLFMHNVVKWPNIL